MTRAIVERTPASQVPSAQLLDVGGDMATHRALFGYRRVRAEA